jgi:hypothetical protein
MYIEDTMKSQNVLKIVKKPKEDSKNSDTPPSRRLWGRVKNIKDIDSAIRLQKEILSKFQRGKLSANDGKTLTYFLQNFISLYRLQLEISEIYKIISYEVEVKVREIVRYFREYCTCVIEELKPDEGQLKRIELRFEGREEKAEEDMIKLRNKIAKEISTSTTFNINPEDDSEKKINIILNECSTKMTHMERCKLYSELEKML